MTRSIGALNETAVEASHVDVVAFVSIAVSPAIYVHSAFGSISFGGDEYLGVGDLGSIGQVEETESLTFQPITLTLSAESDANVTEAFDQANYGAIIEIYEGYRSRGGPLVTDPWLVASGQFDYATVELGDVQNSITVIAENDLAFLDQKSGKRFTAEQYQADNAGDTAGSFIHKIANQKLIWAGGSVNPNPIPAGDRVPPGGQPR